MMRCVVTGGAGFIGSHLVDALVRRGDEVTVIDSLRTGTLDNLREHLDQGSVALVRRDLLGEGWQQALQGEARVYHLAADPDVRQSALDPGSQLRNNLQATCRLLEAMRTAGVGEIVFTSTSTVYGEAAVIPTPEDVTPWSPSPCTAQPSSPASL